MTRFGFNLGCLLVLLFVVGVARAADPDNVILSGIAVLPAATIADGPTSGAFIGTGPINRQRPPFEGQPVQGVSAIINNGDGTYWAMSDNGFGDIYNSADYHLRLYHLQPDFVTVEGGTGGITVLDFIELRDPDGLIGFPIVNHFTEDRILTGADLDIESVQLAPDGSLWLGDEFGPLLLHFSADGVLLEPPVQLPDVRSDAGSFVCAPQSPFSEQESALRVMNAVRTHARLHGSELTPIFSAWAPLIKDNNPNTFMAGRPTSEIFEVASLQRAGFEVLAWGVTREQTMSNLISIGVDGLISERPDVLREAVRKYDGNRDSVPDFIDNALFEGTRFDVQGNARQLRPENTLPAMEAALDEFVTSLQFDLGITRDGVPLLASSPELQTDRCRPLAEDATYDDPLLVNDATAEEIQATYVCDLLPDALLSQTNNISASPVSVAFAELNGLPDPYTPPTLQNVIDFVGFYADYYTSGAGAANANASIRARSAVNVRFNVDVQRDPLRAGDTLAPAPFVQAIADVIIANDLTEWIDVTSLDFETLLHLHEYAPTIQTVFRFTDRNLQPNASGVSPWLAGMAWPYRADACSAAAAQTSGGFEGMALSADGTTLLPLLEKPLTSDPAGTLLIHAFDIAAGAYTGDYYLYPLDNRGAAIGDFIMVNDTEGLVIERDGSQADLTGFKAIYKITLGEPGEAVQKELLVDLLYIQDPNLLASQVLGRDGIGFGEVFAFPFVTIESVFVLDETHIGVLNDNNYPFSVGRYVVDRFPDDTEFIILELPEPLSLE